MKTLTLELIGNETAKVDDTNTVFRFKAYWNGGIVRFTDKDEISFKIGQNNQLVKQAPGYPEKDITQLNASDLTGLKPGTYQLEMWVTHDGKTNIWPTHGFYSFALEQNLMSGDVSEGVSTITLADFERRFSDLSDKQQTQFSELKDQLTDYVGTLQGPKGDPGVSPHINSKGNWQVGDEDTGVRAKGETGNRGPEGPRGKTGERGETGKTGLQGDPGPQGEPGQRGSSIYYSKYEGEPNERGRIWSGLTPTPSDANPPHVGEILITPSGRVYKITAVNATDKTYAIGDEETIIQGPIGPQGLRGPEGVQGPPGKQGKAFTITKSFPSVAEMTGDGLSNGDFVIIASPDEDNGKFYRYNGSDFELVGNLSGTQGIQGPQGDPGPQGAPGEAGITPHIGQNGNWILGDTDTNVRASFNSAMLSEYATKTYVNDKTDVKIITEPIDFNDFTTVGKYYFANSEQKNGPLTEGQWGYLIVSGIQGRTLQFFIIDGQNSRLRRIHWRIYVDDEWSSWEQIAHTSDIPDTADFVKDLHNFFDINAAPTGFSMGMASKIDVANTTGLPENDDFFYVINLGSDYEKVQLAVPLGHVDQNRLGLYRRNCRTDEDGDIAVDWSNWTPVYEMPDLSSYATQNWVTNAISSSLTDYVKTAQAQEIAASAAASAVSNLPEPYVWKPYVADDGMWHLRKEAIE